MGINYVPRKADGSNVIRDENGIVTEVLPEYDGSVFSFTFDNGKAIGKRISGDIIPYQHYIGMQKQAIAIFRKSINEHIDKLPMLMREWPKKERERLDALFNFKCIVTLDGRLDILRNHKKTIIEMSYQDIDSAIRAQYYIIEEYRKNEKLTPKQIEKSNEIVKYISDRVEMLVQEKEYLVKSIVNASSVMKIMLDPGNNILKESAFTERLDEVKNYLKTVWLNPYSKQAKKCLTLLNSSEIKENPRKVIRLAINSLDLNGIEGTELIKSLAKVSKRKNAAKIFKIADNILPEKCIMRYKGTIQIFSLLKVADILEKNAETTLNQICTDCGRKRHCPQA